MNPKDEWTTEGGNIRRFLHGVLAIVLLGGGCADRQCLTIHLYRATDFKSIEQALVVRSHPSGPAAPETIRTDENGMARFCDARYGDLFRIEVIGLSFRWRDGEWMIEQKFLEPLSIPGPQHHAEIPVRLP